MNKLKINLVALFSIFFLISCSYEPIFSQKNYNIELENFTLSGEKDINKVIEDQLSLFKKAEDEDINEIRTNSENEVKTYTIDIISKLSKTIFSKNSKGDPQKFEKTLNVIYKVLYNGEIVLSNEAEEKYVYNNESDKFKLEQTEMNIKENLAINITNIIISSIINIDDN